MKFSTLGLVLCAAFAMAIAPDVTAQPYIVKDGRPRAQIVIADRPTRMQSLAAEQLRTYIRKISGAELPIVVTEVDAYPVKIYVGQSRYTDALGLQNKDLDFGAYRVKSGRDYLVLMGRDTDYFMGRPGEGGAVYPAGRSERTRVEEAWQKMHGEQWASPLTSHFKGYNKHLKVWEIDEHGSLNAVNDFLRSLGVRWYMPRDFGEVLPQGTRTIAVPEIDRTVRPEWSQRYIAFYHQIAFQASAEEMLWQLRLGSYPPKEQLGSHGTDYLVTPEWVKENHPEYYALYGGRRATDGKGAPCYSSDGLLGSAVGFSKLMFDEYHKDIVSLLPTDGYTAFCQCELCEGKDTPERGFKGMMSDYVWSFMDRTAREVAKTHPDKQILCYAYNTYRQPPETIGTFHPNLRVGICGGRKAFHDPEQKKMWLELREGFLEKIPSGKISLWEYYNVRDGMPAYYPRIIAEDLQWLEGRINGTFIGKLRSRYPEDKQRPDLGLAVTHLNLWLTARLWWAPDPQELWWNDAQNVDDMLNTYYQRFYGPAAEPMKTFIEFSEANYPQMHISPEPIDQAFALIQEARSAAGEDNIYAKRVQMVIDYMQPLKPIRENLAVGRKDNPVATFVERNPADIELDGRFDDAFWQNLQTYELKETETGEKLPNRTTFKMAWAGDSLYLAIRCEEENMDGLVIPATRDGDNTIFDGDSVELQLETATHAYYQIAIDPKGHVNDLDRPDASMIGKTGQYNTKWEAGLELATLQDKDFWTVELRIPALGANQEELLPNFGVAGDKPTRDAPWYFNVCRIRKAGGETQTSAFSPTGESGFHYMRKFARLIPE